MFFTASSPQPASDLKSWTRWFFFLGKRFILSCFKHLSPAPYKSHPSAVRGCKIDALFCTDTYFSLYLLLPLNKNLGVSYPGYLIST